MNAHVCLCHADKLSCCRNYAPPVWYVEIVCRRATIMLTVIIK